MKKLIAEVKLQIPAGKANPSPPIGPALGQHGVNIMDFCKAFNAKTAKQEGLIIPVVISIFADRSFTFITKTPPASILLLKAAGLDKGSGEPNRTKVGKVTAKQVQEIATLKMPDLNTKSIGAAVRMVRGTARSMGIDVAGRRPSGRRRFCTTSRAPLGRRVVGGSPGESVASPARSKRVEGRGTDESNGGRRGGR